MAYHNRANAAENLNGNPGFGVPAHDYIQYLYGTGGGSSSTNLTDIKYYRGGLQAGGDLVAHIQYTYDSSDNVTAAERVA